MCPAFVWRGTALRSSDLGHAIKLTEIREAARIECQIMALERAPANKIGANCTHAIAAGSFTHPRSPDCGGKTGAHFLDRARAAAAQVRARIETNNNMGRSEAADVDDVAAGDCRLQLSARHCIRGAGSTINHQYPRRGCGAPLDVPARIRMLESVISIVCVTSAQFVLSVVL
jgi:hypothetical protein